MKASSARAKGDDGGWRDDVPCIGLGSMFFSDNNADVNRAKAVCRTCDKTEPCLAFALEHSIKWGVWGGKSGRERRDIRSQRRVTANRLGPR